MAVTRETYDKKIYGEGNAEECFVEMRRTRKMTFESGDGFNYYKVVYTFEWSDDENDPGSRDIERKAIKNPADADQFVRVPVVKSVLIESGDGYTWQGKRIHWNNDKEENKIRQTHSKTITGSDGFSQVTFAVIDGWATKIGDGFNYQRAERHPNWPPPDDDDPRGAGG